MTDERFDSKRLYDRYNVTIATTNRLYGGTPRNGELIEAWVKARTGHDDEITKGQVETVTQEMIDTVAEKCWIGFCRDPEKGLYIHTRNLKAMIKQGASMLRITVKKVGSKQVLAEGTEVKGPDHPDRIYLGKVEPDGTDEHPIHVQTAQGPRTALKRADFVEDVTLKFEIWVLKTDSKEKRHIGEDELVDILAFSQENGIGADRSQGNGKFRVVEFARVS